LSYGAQAKVGFARQASVNSWVTDATSFHGFGFTNEDIGLEIDEVISQNLNGVFEEGAVYSGVNRINGTIEFEVTPRNLGMALAMVANHVPVEATSGSVKTRTFLPNTQDFSSQFCKAPFTMYKQFTDATSAELFYDCQLGQLEFTLAQGALLRARATVNGGVRLPTGIGSLSVLPVGSDVKRLFPWNVASISYGGNGLSNFSEITTTLNENVDALYTVNGTLSPFKYTRTAFRQVSVNGTFFLTDRTFLNNFAAGTQARLTIYMINTLTAIQSGYFDSLLIDIPQAKITAFKPGASGPGEVSVNVTMRGVADPSSGYAIQFTQQSTYAPGY
jgi:hypothetical protein